MTIRLICGDCVEKMRELPEASIDAVVCDPPYGLEFMGKDWDSHASPIVYQEWCEAWAFEAFRVLKPGGHLLAFGGSRTYHRLAAGVEDAGFEIRDQLQWLYGSGFPKSLDVSKAIDKAAGAEREVIGSRTRPDGSSARVGVSASKFSGRTFAADEHSIGIPANDAVLTSPATPEAEQWQGWGTALKPAHEPIVLARKPLIGTVARNVLEHGTGALNIDGTRIETTDRWEASGVQSEKSIALSGGADGSLNVSVSSTHDGGRWPANVILDEEVGAILDAQTEGKIHGAGAARTADEGTHSGERAEGWGNMGAPAPRFGDSGGPSRFFYCAKTSKRERNAGLEDHPMHPAPASSGNRLERMGSRSGPRQNNHPTVKPVALMQWLARLVTPPGGTILDPFVGSGSTGIACVREGFTFVGIDQSYEYLEIARDRIGHALDEDEDA